MTAHLNPMMAMAAAGLDAYEGVARAASELAWATARGAAPQPCASWSAAWGDLARDTAAVQLSTVRWVLDL